MAIIGLPKSPSCMPVARHRARAPAMLRPWVVVLERYTGMTSNLDKNYLLAIIDKHIKKRLRIPLFTALGTDRSDVFTVK